jgi:hypothetical protein
VQIAGLLVEVDGLYVEPFHLTVTEFHQEAPAFFPDRLLYILQISDLHIERITPRERRLLAKVDALQPDLIVLTGDYVNQDYLNDPRAMQDARQVLSELHAPYGIYAIIGTTDTPEVMRTVFDSLENIRVLDDEVVGVYFPGGNLYLVGLTTESSINRDRQILTNLLAEFPPDIYTLLLYHTPDIIETASATDVDLFLTGHTHGGQIRLPLYGALVTFSDYGKKYEMGRYQVGSTTMYVSRGLGMEGLHMPRARFLCPPELVLLLLA